MTNTQQDPGEMVHGEVVTTGPIDFSSLLDRPIQFHQLTRAEQKLITDVICKGLTADEITMFVRVCNRTRLDPFAGQIHAVKRWDRKMGREVMAIQTGIDGYRLISERTGKYVGQTPAEWCGKDGKWVEVWTSDGPPYASRVGIKKMSPFNTVEVFWGVALYREFVQRDRDGNPTRMWEHMPVTMLAKCAEAQGHRKANPAETQGVMTDDEMYQADTPDDAPAVPLPKRVSTGRQLTPAPTPPPESDEPPPQDEPPPYASTGPDDHLPPPKAKTTKKATTPAPTTTQPVVTENAYQGRVDKVIVKHGEGQNGPWTLYRITLKDGPEVRTFDGDMGQKAQDLCDACRTVVAVYKQDGKYTKLVSIGLASA